MAKKKIIVSVTNDLATDQRTRRLCSTLHSEGYEVILTGRLLPGSLPLVDRPYKTRRVKHWFNSKVFYYAEYNTRLFFYLLFNRFDILHANDLDTLPANFLASKLKRKPLIYDSHEYFTEVPEITNRPVVKKSWELVEKLMFPRVSRVITVNSSIAGIYEKKYGKKVHVVRNVPEKLPVNMKGMPPSYWNLPENKKLVILQGAGINRDRGAEEAVMSMAYIENTVLIIAGDGDIVPGLKKLVEKNRLTEKVYFIPRMPYEKLIQLTSACDCGLSLDKDSNLNYRFSLPNKLFDYIIAGIPVLGSSLPEVKAIIEKYEIGIITESHDPETIAAKLKFLLFNSPKNKWRQNLARAAGELNWENEKHELLEVYNSLDN
jgi:glycosyltransferase involved in cell wall biosynthesis